MKLTPYGSKYLLRRYLTPKSYPEHFPRRDHVPNGDDADRSVCAHRPDEASKTPGSPVVAPRGGRFVGRTQGPMPRTGLGTPHRAGDANDYETTTSANESLQWRAGDDGGWWGFGAWESGFFPLWDVGSITNNFPRDSLE